MQHRLFGSSSSVVARTLGCLGVIAAMALAQNASSQQIYATKFEAPPFVAGLPLVGQDGWICPALFSPSAAIVSTDKARQGKQTVHVAGVDLVETGAVFALTGFYGSLGSYRKPLNIDTGGVSVVRFSTHVRLDGPLTPGTTFFSVGIAARRLDFSGGTNPGTRGIGQIDLYSDGNVYVHDGNRNIPLFLASAPISLGEWHELALIEDVGANTFTAEVDGVSLGTYPMPPLSVGAVATNIIARAALLATSLPDTASMKKADYVATMDYFAARVTGK